MTISLTHLAAPFLPEQIHWRAQNLTRDGDKALALAYLDARDVMDRLDAVCGPANWQDRYEFHGSRTVCYLSIRLGDEWITKADGAGDSDVEAEKGAISDALKRAAVKWGIGRYLYDLGDTWVPCASYEASGKKRWKKWTDDPWNYVRDSHRFMPPAAPAAISAPAKAKEDGTTYRTAAGYDRKPGPRLTDESDIKAALDALIENIAQHETVQALDKWAGTVRTGIESLPDDAFDMFRNAYLNHRTGLRAARSA